MELYLIRHGQSLNNALEDSGCRVADPPLTDLGQEQALRVAAHLKTADQPGMPDGCGYGLTQLFCSAMLRTLQTAAPIAEALGMASEIWLDVHEEGGIWLDAGDGPVGYSGLARSEIAMQFPGTAIPEVVTDAGWWNREKETPEELRARALRVALAIRERFAHTEERVGVVTHGAFANALIQTLTSGALRDDVYFGHYNTGISRIDFIDGVVRPRFLNRVEHLSSDMRT